MATVEKHAHDHDDASCDEGDAILEISESVFKAAQKDPAQHRSLAAARDFYRAAQARAQAATQRSTADTDAEPRPSRRRRYRAIS